MALERDSQRKKVYSAIATVAKSVGTPLPTMPEVERFVRKVMSRSTLQRRYGLTLTKDIDVRDGRGKSWATGDRDMITVPKVQRNTIYVLRAMAYTIGMRYRGFYPTGDRTDLKNRKAAWHGWEYCAILMDLVRYGLGEEEAKALKAEFSSQNIKWRQTKARAKLNPAASAAAQERGRKVAALMKDRRRRIEFVKKYPDAELASPDEFTDPHWETLYRVFR